MAFYHGVSTRQQDTSISTPVTADSGVAFVVGSAPVHMVGGKVNEPVYCLNYNEAVAAFGYSDDWEKYTLCEVIYSHFQLYGVSPVVLVNVLDPEKHKTSEAAKEYAVTDGQASLPLEAIADTVKVVATTDEEGKTTYYKAGTDYDVLYDGGHLIVEVLDGGGVPAGTTALTISFDAVDPGKLTESDVIGGFNTNTKKNSGLELLDSAFPKYRVVCDLIAAPGWSHNSTVAAVMGAKAESINGVFTGKALIDVDTGAVTHYADVPEWKSKNNINSKAQVLCWPKVKLGDRAFYLSTQAIGRMAKTDTDNGGCPAESPSNKTVQIDSPVLANGDEVLLDLQQANYLNSNGVVTALNMMGGFVLWGNETACYPSDTDVKNYFIPVSRMFDWVGNSLILTYWSKVDKKMTRRLVDSIVDSVNIWLNSLVAEDQLLGGRVEFLEEENSDTALMSGKAVFHIYMTPPSPAKEIEFVLEYDVDYVSAALVA